MKRLSDSTLIACVFLILISLNSSIRAQESKHNTEAAETCSEPIYERKEVSRPAKITSELLVDLTEEARARGREGRVILSVVLCRTGRVTDIIVKKEMPYGMTEKTVEFIRELKFTPAEKDGQTVSQRQVFEFQFEFL